MRRTASLVAVAVVATLCVFAGPRVDAAAGCRPNSLKTPYTAPGPGVSIDGLGNGTPAYYEIGDPTGGFTGRAPKAIMALIHGGAWQTVGKEAVANTRTFANHWRAQGWQTLSVSYRPCEQSFSDVLWFMERLRQLAPHAKICAEGISSGGHLALMLASARPDLACVIALGGPSDTPSLPKQTSYNPKTHLYDSAGPRELFYAIGNAFGPSQATAMSPSYYVTRVRARVLVASAVRDVIVPAAQNSRYVDALRVAQPSLYVSALLLQPGREQWIHGKVSKDALKKYDAAEAALVAPLVR